MTIQSRCLELVLESDTGKLSHTKLWANVGSAAATAVFIKQGWAGTLSSEVFGLYLAGVCGAAAVSKMLSLKYGVAPAADPKEGA